MLAALVVDGRGLPPPRFMSCLAGSTGHRAACDHIGVDHLYPAELGGAR